MWQDNIKIDIETGCVLHSAWLGHDEMVGRFENGNEPSVFIKDFLLIDVHPLSVKF
jgi:hypothetical protein